MDKNKFLGLVIIGLIIFGTVFYVIWLLFFNKGQLVVEGIPPFNLSIGGNSYTCLQQQCSYELGAREYSYLISKDGYFDQSGYVDIKRGKTIIVSYEEAFKARPLIGVDYPMLRLPVGYSKFGDKLLEISLFHLIQDGYMLKRMPKKINNIQFSPSGKGAILFEDSKVNYYDTQTFTTKELPADIYSVAWTSDESAIYSVIYDDVSKKDTLVRLNLEDDSLEKDIYFLRDIEKYSISVSPDERYVVLLDSTSDIQILYIIDMEEKTRKNVFEGYSITLGEWSRDGDFYVFNGMAKDEDISSSWMLITQDKSVESLGFNVSPRLITGAPDEKFYFFSTQNYSLSGDTRPYFSIFENQDESLVLNDLVNPETLSLHMFDARTRQIYLILELTDVITAVPKKIEINWEGSIVRMLVDDQYFDVKVGE